MLSDKVRSIVVMVGAIRTHVELLVDIWSMKLFVSMFGQNGELLDSHLFFFDRYSELADRARRNGRIAIADRLAAIAEAHFQMAPDDEPPAAAAMAMPVPTTATEHQRGEHDTDDQTVLGATIELGACACTIATADKAERATIEFHFTL